MTPKDYFLGKLGKDYCVEIYEFISPKFFGILKRTNYIKKTSLEEMAEKITLPIKEGGLGFKLSEKDIIISFPRPNESETKIKRVSLEEVFQFKSYLQEFSYVKKNKQKNLPLDS